MQNNYNTKIIELSSGEPNYEMIESTSKKIFKEKAIVEKFGGKLIFTDEESFSSSKNINETSMEKELIYTLYIYIYQL